MARLDEDPGPAGSTHGLMPSAPDERGAPRWLVFSMCNVYAVDAASVDEARALVLERLGYGHRPELAGQLDARPASPAEIKLVCIRRRQRPWRIDPRRPTAHRKVIRDLARIIRENDLREHGDGMEGLQARRHSVPSRAIATAVLITHQHSSKAGAFQ